MGRLDINGELRIAVFSYTISEVLRRLVLAILDILSLSQHSRIRLEN